MNPFAIACLMLAAINGCVGGLYLLLYLRRREQQEHLPFALLCFCLVAYDLFCAGLYNARSLEQGIAWQRLQLLSLSLVTGCTIWFLGIFIGRRLTGILRVYVASLCILVPLALAIDRPGMTLSPLSPSIKVIRHGSRVVMTYYESRVGIVYAIALLATYLAYGYLFHQLYRAYRRRRSSYLLAVIVGQGAFVAGLVNDGLVATGAYSFIYVSEYAYLVVILTMAYALLNRVVDLSLAVEQLNRNLEQRIEEAIADIKVLRGLIPICANCKKIRDDKGYWNQVEVYIQQRSDARFSHHICPECIRVLYPEHVTDRVDTRNSGGE
jgi:N-terminal 7TM region of histidine kinase